MKILLKQPLMQDQQLYEYAVIRIVPRVEREEFINAGIIVFCKEQDYLACKTFLSEERLLCIYAEADLDQINRNLKAFEEIATGQRSESAIAQLDKPSRFRWLTATRSTVVQTSKVHPGLCSNPEELIQKLFEQLVK